MLSPPESAGGPLPRLVPALSAGLRARGHTVGWSAWGAAQPGESLLGRVAGRWVQAGQARAAALKTRADVVVIHTAHNRRAVTRDWVLLRFLRRARVPTMLVLHGSTPRSVSDSPKSLFSRCTLATLRQAAVIGVTSSEELEAWSALLPSALVARVKNPVAPVKENLPHDPLERAEPRPILFAARLIAAKGCSRVVEAYAGIPSELRPGLVVAGDGPERLRLEEQVGELGLEGEVSFVGYVDSPTLDRLYASASMLILPTVHDEGLPMVLLEAAAHGLPLITTGFRGAADYLEDGLTALLVDPLDISAVRRAMRRLLEDREMASAMSAQLRKLSTVFAPSSVAAEYEHALCDAMRLARIGHRGGRPHP